MARYTPLLRVLGPALVVALVRHIVDDAGVDGK